MSDSKFPVFAGLVATAFQDLNKNPNIFVVDLDGDTLYQEYLAAFPEGTNPVFKKNREYDCSCCHHFIRRAGGVVTIDEVGYVHTVWDLAATEAPAHFREIATRLRDVVRTRSIADIFRVGQSETSFGAPQTRSLDPETQQAITWNHFHTGEIRRNLRVALPDTERGNYRTTVQVFERGLVELTTSAVEIVLSLIEGNALYRGEEHKPALLQFQQAQTDYMTRGDERKRSLFVWANAGNPAARFRNTVIGTLVQDLSEGKDLDLAVKGFETKVAPQNYKRTTALITPSMVKQAMEKIDELGLEEALERRFAMLKDISVNDVKWVDGSVRSFMKGGLKDVLMKHATSNKPVTKDEARAEDISLDDFMTTILPESSSLEIFFKSEHVGNLMSLTAPVHSEPKQLFRWNNDFAWSYCGNVADSIKERVKRAGGKVEGVVLRVSLSWFNYDDLDLHIYEPAGRGKAAVYDHIFYANKTGWTGGKLDVDMNAGGTRSREAVENVVWTHKPVDGDYRVVVNNFSHREAADPGFVIEVENAGKISHFSYNKIVRNSQNITVATLHMKGGVLERVEPGDPGITAANISQEKWGLKTEQYVKVSTVVLSPNYWGDNHVGNKHTFFILEGAKNDELTRGFYNEFLHPRLESHRKVFEVIADKTKCQPSVDQLSGLGFSSTKQESFLIRAQHGKKQRVFNVHVGG